MNERLIALVAQFRRFAKQSSYSDDAGEAWECAADLLSDEIKACPSCGCDDGHNHKCAYSGE